VPGIGPSGSATGGEGDAVWLDLVARFNAPMADEAAPWPDREDLVGPVSVTPVTPPSVPDALPQEPPTNPGLSALPGVFDERSMNLPELDSTGLTDPDLANAGLDETMLNGPRLDDVGLGVPGLDGTMPDRAWARPRGRHARDWSPTSDPTDEHYIPPVPPPLPRLKPATKVAWLALFGGPIYLLVSVATGSPISGLAAFLAVAAFIGGFVVIVLRMDNGRPPDSGSGDDGAVV
jgi:hypothetical protein